MIKLIPYCLALVLLNSCDTVQYFTPFVRIFKPVIEAVTPQPETIVWQAHANSLGPFKILANGGLFHDGDHDRQGYAVSQQTFTGPIRVTFEVYTQNGRTYNLPDQFGIQKRSDHPSPGDTVAFFMCGFNNWPLAASPNAILTRFPALAGDKFAIEVSNGTEKYFRNGTLIYTANNPVPSGPLEFYVIMTGTVSVDQALAAATFEVLQ